MPPVFAATAFVSFPWTKILPPELSNKVRLPSAPPNSPSDHVSVITERHKALAVGLQIGEGCHADTGKVATHSD